MRLFEYINDLDYYANKLKVFFKSLGLRCKIQKENFQIIINAADNSKYDYNWMHNDHTGLFMYFYPYFKKATSFENLKFLIHVGSIVIAQEKRGKGLANKIISNIIDIFGDDLYAFEYTDLSKGFWDHLKAKYPQVKFISQDY
jgi:predicted GNAT family N-acyltransferase